jgi:hypothetical protein
LAPVVLKELIDNALDACEDAGAAPVIHVEVSDAEIAVFDNGPGIAPETVVGILDYNTRTSSCEAYCSPTRGAQGNALKTLLGMPFALDGERGETTIESQGVAHRITFSIDPIRQEPRLVRVGEDGSVKSGTRVAVSWPISANSTLDDAQAAFLRIAEGYTWVNPHLTLKWWRSDPTSPHWYEVPRLARLIANNIAYAQDHGILCRTIWDFVREFRGLSATVKAKAICETVSASRLSLTQFYGDGERARVGALLVAMRKQNRPVKPRDLGIIGEAHLRAKFESASAAAETFSYKRSEIEHDGVPYLAEAAFGYCPKGSNERRIVTGVNWSPAIGGDPFRPSGRASTHTSTHCQGHEHFCSQSKIARGGSESAAG